MVMVMHVRECKNMAERTHAFTHEAVVMIEKPKIVLPFPVGMDVHSPHDLGERPP